MDILYEDSETTKIRYTSFIGSSNTRFDLAVINTDRFYGKVLVIDILGGRTVIIGRDDLAEPGYLEESFKINEDAANDLYDFLSNFV